MNENLTPYPADDSLQRAKAEADERYCRDCIHNEVCRWCPHDGCDFKAKAEPDNGWISVKDRLPENQNDVIVCDVRGNVYSAYYFPFLHGWLYAFTAETCKHEITRWQPLPKPPKGE